jgi:coenzyme F420-reducing hydrogenase beta subunit
MRPIITKYLIGRNVTTKKAQIKNMKKVLVVGLSCQVSNFSAFSIKFEKMSRKKSMNRNLSTKN